MEMNERDIQTDPLNNYFQFSDIPALNRTPNHVYIEPVVSFTVNRVIFL